MEVIRESVTLEHLVGLAESGFGSLVKAVVDVDKGIMAIGGEMHADEEAALLGLGSSQTDLWGSISTRRTTVRRLDRIRLDDQHSGAPGNRSRGVEDPTAQEKIVRRWRLVRS